MGLMALKLLLVNYLELRHISIQNKGYFCKFKGLDSIITKRASNFPIPIAYDFR